jgi:hypothetical protein
MKRQNAIVTAGVLSGVLTLGSAGLVFASGSSASSPKVVGTTNIAPTTSTKGLAPVTVTVKVPTNVMVVVPTTEAPDTETNDDATELASTGATATTEAPEATSNHGQTEADDKSEADDKADDTASAPTAKGAPVSRRGGGDDHGPATRSGGGGDDHGDD